METDSPKLKNSYISTLKSLPPILKARSKKFFGFLDSSDQINEPIPENKFYKNVREIMDEYTIVQKKIGSAD